jgi:hypothetical protein
MIKVAGRDPVEMVSVMVRQHDEVQRGQLLNGQGGFRQPPGAHAHANVGAITPVQEIGIGQYGEPGDLDDRRRGPHKRDLVNSALPDPRQLNRRLSRQKVHGLTRSSFLIIGPCCSSASFRWFPGLAEQLLAEHQADRKTAFPKALDPDLLQGQQG